MPQSLDSPEINPWYIFKSLSIVPKETDIQGYNDCACAWQGCHEKASMPQKVNVLCRQHGLRASMEAILNRARTSIEHSGNVGLISRRGHKPRPPVFGRRSRPRDGESGGRLILAACNTLIIPDDRSGNFARAIIFAINTPPFINQKKLLKLDDTRR